MFGQEFKRLENIVNKIVTALDSLVCRCGYELDNGGSQQPPSIAGVLGLSSSKATIVSQLSNLGHVSNVVGHCLGRQGGGFLFFGGNLVPFSRMLWMPMRNPEGLVSTFFEVI